MERPKTIFCDIDGTLWDHVGDITEQVNVESHKLLPNTMKALNRWDKLGYRIILTTGRRESMRDLTESHLKKIGIVYDMLIMGLGGGARVLINDRKPNSTKNTAYAVNLIRNEGLQHFDFSTEYCTLSTLSKDKKITENEEIQIVEFNDNYILSKIKLYSGKTINNYNPIRKKTFCVLKGQLTITINNESKKINSAETITIPPSTHYSRTSNGLEHTEYFETSSV